MQVEMNVSLFARDSRLWVVLFYASMAFVIGTGFIERPEDYGLSVIAFRWLKLIAAVLAGLSGKNGMSWMPTQRTIEERK